MLNDAQRLEADLLALSLAEALYLDFARYVFRGWQDTAHHRLLAEYLEQVEHYIVTGGREGIGRLLVFMPPRHGKSLNVSVLFPTWFLGRNPDRRVIITSYNASLAQGFSRQARNLMFDTRYRAVFGDLSGQPEAIRISDDSRAVESWELAGKKGGMVAAGVGGGITGKGAHLFIVDDPHKDRADVESAARREAVWAWWTSTAYTRLEDGAAVIGMLTRWHNDDWAGRLLSRMMQDEGADRWTVLCLPAIAEEWAESADPEMTLTALRDGWWMGEDPLGRAPGEPLWPEKYDLDVLKTIKANVGGYDWTALYQQRPRKLEGKLIKANQIKIIDADQVPGEVVPVRYWDLAVSRKKRANFICGVKGGRDGQKRFYIMDVARIPAPWSSARPQMIKVMLRDPMEVRQGIEVAGQQDGYYQELRDDEQLHERIIVPIGVRGDKESRAQLWATKIEDDLVFMVRGPWNEEFIAEAVSFPDGRDDDQVDGVSGVWQMLPGFVSMADLPQAPNVASKWALFGRESADLADLAEVGGRWP